jgi:hypothetical protein
MRDNTSAEMDAALVTELKNALIDIDPEATERAAKKLELRGVVLEQLLPRVRLSRTLADLKKLVRNEDSADRVDAFNRNFQGAIREFDLDRSQREDVSLEVENILESLRARLTITEQPTEKPGAMVTAPQGEVLVLFYPPLGPAGKVFLLGSEVLAVGSASTGDLVLGKAEALKVMNVPVSEDTAAETIAAEKASSYVTSGTLVLHRRKYDQPMSYEINDRKYSIKPGESQTLPAGSSWVIAFDKGGKQARYTLGEGSYVFAPKDGGWDLSSKKFEITIENPAMAGQFLLLINEEPLTIPAGKALSLTANYPIIVGFDRGDGGEPAYRRLYDGTYTVAINKADGLWDVFETAATPPTTATEGETASSAAK